MRNETWEQEIPQEWEMSYHELERKFVGTMIRDGKRQVAERIFTTVLGVLKKENQAQKGAHQEDPRTTFVKALERVRPFVETRSVRVGGSTYRVPIEMLPNRQRSVAIRWVLEGARQRKTKAFSKALALELKAASQGQGNAIRKRDECHKLAHGNRENVHFRW